jgi:hypothetical protein
VHRTYTYSYSHASGHLVYCCESVYTPKKPKYRVKCKSAVTASLLVGSVVLYY